MMKRLAMAAFLLFAVLGAGVEAGPLPEPISVIQRHQTSNVTPYVRSTGHKLPDPIRMVGNDRHRGTWQTHAVRGK
jgi:hypothetical protein